MCSLCHFFLKKGAQRKFSLAFVCKRPTNVISLIHDKPDLSHVYVSLCIVRLCTVYCLVSLCHLGVCMFGDYNVVIKL